MNVVQLFFNIIFISLLLGNANSLSSIRNENADTEDHHRAKRLARFPFNSCFALAMVVAIPLGLKGRSVYVSFNFETNYYLPYFDNVQGLVPIPFTTIDEPGVNAGTVIENADPDRPNTRQFDNDKIISETNGNDTMSNGTVENLNITTTVNETILLPVKTSSAESEIKSVPNTSESPSKKNSTTKSSSLKVTKEKSKPTATATVKVTKKVKTNTEKTESKTSINKQQEENPREKSTDKKIIRKNREILKTFVSRKKLYKTLMDKLDSYGLNGKACLLRAICEASEQPLGDHNGVLGDIVHIMFTPTTSRDEKLPFKFYQAEYDGNVGSCKQYTAHCSMGLFDFITVME